VKHAAKRSRRSTGSRLCRERVRSALRSIRFSRRRGHRRKRPSDISSARGQRYLCRHLASPSDDQQRRLWPVGSRLGRGRFGRATRARDAGQYILMVLRCVVCCHHRRSRLRLVRVVRMNGAFGAGRILNRKTAESQMRGGG